MIRIILVALLAVSVANAQDVICDKCVDRSDIANKAIDATKLGTNAVNTSKLKNNAVTTAKIANGAVTVDKVAPEIAASIGQTCTLGQVVVGFQSDGQILCDPVSGGGKPQFVGFSDQTVGSGSGYKPLVEACQAKYGITANIATSRQIVESGIFPAATKGKAWVGHEFVGNDFTDYNSDSSAKLVDFSGITDQAEKFTCRSWTYVLGGGGLSVNTFGYSFWIEDCGSVLPVACSVK